MQRILEQELMDDEAQVAAYVAADFSASNQWFADAVTAGLSLGPLATVDLGCGPADVLIRIARTNPSLRLTGVDGSSPMLARARLAIADAGVADRVHLVEARMPTDAIVSGSFDLVLSKDVLHHLPDPSVLWTEVRRLARPGARVCVMDLMRSASPEAARRLVEDVVGGADPVLKTDFYNSLFAAFTVEEVAEQLRDAGLALRVAQVSERHMLIEGHLP
jgi:ubiquinone/menaquinone biosynthesis C-methylase UbiE